MIYFQLFILCIHVKVTVTTSTDYYYEIRLQCGQWSFYALFFCLLCILPIKTLSLSGVKDKSKQLYLVICSWFVQTKCDFDVCNGTRHWLKLLNITQSIRYCCVLMCNLQLWQHKLLQTLYTTDAKMPIFISVTAEPICSLSESLNLKGIWKDLLKP